MQYKINPVANFIRKPPQNKSIQPMRKNARLIIYDGLGTLFLGENYY